MQFRLVQYFEQHPVQKRLVKWWIQLGLPLPGWFKREIANQIHAEMLVRLMAMILRKGNIDLEEALASQYRLGEELAEQVADYLSLRRDDASSLARVVDFLHSVLGIRGKRVVVNGQREHVSRWTICPLAAQLREAEGGAGVYYCHLYQEIYKGMLAALNPQARANTLTVTQSLGEPHCEIRTWIA